MDIMRKGTQVAVSWLFLLLIGCSSDDENGGFNPGTGQLIIQAITGQWTATSAQFNTINANPVLSRDVIADGGFCDFSVAQGGNFTLVIRNPGTADPQITTGRLIADGVFIDVRFDTDPNMAVRWDFTISGDNLFITGPLAYDFENDGIFEETTANMSFVPS